MININCTNCKASLEIDDAFAGGVCRCQYCGTIQTVPAHLKGTGTGAGTAPAAKPLYQTGRGGGTGLDELSDAVASSGLARSALQKKPGGQQRGGVLEAAPVEYATPRKEEKSKKTLMIILGAVAALLLVGLGSWFFLGSSSTVVTKPAPTGGPITITEDDDAPIVVPKTANFCGVDLQKASGVCYVLDRGSATGELFDTLKATAYESVRTLGPEKKFAIIFWDNGSGNLVAYPETGMAPATPTEIDAADRAFEDVVAFGRSDPKSALKSAADRKPSDVIFVTAKADDLPDDVVSFVEGGFDKSTKVHTAALVEDYGSVLKSLAEKKNGHYQVIRAAQLRAFSRSH